MRSRTRRCGCRTPDLGVLHSPRVPPHARRATDAFSILQRVLPRCSHPSEPPLRRPAARWQMPLEASAPRPRGPCFRPGRRAARLRTSVAAGRTLAASLFSPWHCARPASLRPLRACCSLPCSRQGRQPPLLTCASACMLPPKRAARWSLRVVVGQQPRLRHAGSCGGRGFFRGPQACANRQHRKVL